MSVTPPANIPNKTKLKQARFLVVHIHAFRLTNNRDINVRLPLCGAPYTSNLHGRKIDWEASKLAIPLPIRPPQTQVK